jgi:hypothetical protein
MSLRIPFEIGQRKVTDIQFQNVTRLHLGFCSSRLIGKYFIFYFDASNQKYIYSDIFVF